MPKKLELKKRNLNTINSKRAMPKVRSLSTNGKNSAYLSSFQKVMKWYPG